MPLPYSVHVYRSLFRSAVTFGHVAGLLGACRVWAQAEGLYGGAVRLDGVTVVQRATRAKGVELHATALAADDDDILGVAKGERGDGGGERREGLQQPAAVEEGACSSGSD